MLDYILKIKLNLSNFEGVKYPHSSASCHGNEHGDAPFLLHFYHPLACYNTTKFHWKSTASVISRESRELLAQLCSVLQTINRPSHFVPTVVAIPYKLNLYGYVVV